MSVLILVAPSACFYDLTGRITHPNRADFFSNKNNGFCSDCLWNIVKKILITITICVSSVVIIKSYRIFPSVLTEYSCKFAQYSCSNSPTIVAKSLCNFYCLRGRTFFHSIGIHLFLLQSIRFVTAILQSFLNYFYYLSLKVAINGIDITPTFFLFRYHNTDRKIRQHFRSGKEYLLKATSFFFCCNNFINQKIVCL